MNYERALKTLVHGRTKKPLEWKKVGNETWLHRVVSADGGPHLVDLVLFGKHILTWKPNGNIALDNKGWWTRTTKDRYHQYLPAGFHLFQDRPFWFLHTPTGTRVFRKGMELTPEGFDVTTPLTKLHDARNVQLQVHLYVREYIKRLLRGELQKPGGSGDCATCLANDRTTADHVYEHLQNDTFPSSLLLNRVTWLPVLADAVGLLWQENQKIWRRPRTRKAFAERAEAVILMETPPPTTRPDAHARALRRQLQDFLLETFGFEEMAD